MATILCVLYDDPVDGYPPEYARDEVPKIERYPDGQTTPTPDGLDFTPGELLGCVSGALGLRGYARTRGTSSSSPRTRTAPTPSSSAGSQRPTWSSRSRSGPRT